MIESTNINSLTEAAFEQQRDKDFLGALKTWNKILVQDKGNTKALFNKHKCLYYLGRYEEALTTIQIFLKNHPNYIPGHTQLVYTFMRMRERCEALEAVVLSLSKFPNDLTLLIAKVRVLISLEDFDKAKKLISIILEQDAHNDIAQQFLNDVARFSSNSTYDEDGLKTKHNHEFVHLPKFMEAYKRGIKAANDDYHWRWRVHVGLWSASIAAKLTGDFVECGVNKGFLSSAILRYLNWNELGKKFYLLDTFKGIDERYLLEKEIENGILNKNEKELQNGFYTSDVESVRQNFEEWNNIHIIEGSIPDTLPSIICETIAFLHIDLNCTKPEIDAITYCWDKLVDGAIVLLDDYAGTVRILQKQAMDDFAKSVSHEILSLPTGQGLLIKNNR